MRVVFCLAACACVLAVALICAFLFANGLPFFGKVNALDFLLGEKWKPTNDIYGILPMILGQHCISLRVPVLFGAPIADAALRCIWRTLRPSPFSGCWSPPCRCWRAFHQSSTACSG